MQKLFFYLVFFFLVTSANAAITEPRYIILPNVKTTYLMSTNALKALNDELKAIEVTKKTLHLTKQSPYQAVRIRLIYNDSNDVKALIIYLLSSVYKSMDIVRINLDSHWQVSLVINNYRIVPQDLSQSPLPVKGVPKCPDDTVQFVVANNFYGDDSVENEVQNVYKAAEAKGYHPFLMDINHSNGPQPTVQAYENWLSCPNVKGFYNESHGNETGIALTDGDFTHQNINDSLIAKLKQNVVLLDSCLTFHNPLLDAFLSKDKANTQQYTAGIISLPFGASERTARCFWYNALDHQALTREMLNTCAINNGLNIDDFGIGGNGDKYLLPAS